MKSTPRDGILRGATAALARLFLAAAAGISAYLLSVSLTGGQALGCGVGSSCDEVLQSRWAYVLGIPVSALALLVDLTLLLTTFACAARSSPKQRRSAWEILVPCSVLVVGAALWFVALQLLVVHRVCFWCMTAHVSGAAAAVLLLRRVPVTDAVERRDKDPSLLRGKVMKLCVAAVLGVALLGIAQTLAPRKTHSVANVPPSAAPALANQAQTSAPPLPTNPPALAMPKTNATAAATNPSPLAAVAAQTNPPPAAAIPSGNTLEVYGGRVRLDLAQVPIWGSPEAPVKLISLYDYTCHYCRDAHPAVVELQRMFSNKLAIVSLPMPLDGSCNPVIRRTPRPHTNACSYARIGLTVWRAKRGALQAFDDWLFGYQNPPPLVDVTNKAVELVGRTPFDMASRDPWVEQQLRADIEFFSNSIKEFPGLGGNMPQFMVGTNFISGPGAPEALRALVPKYIEAAAK